MATDGATASAAGSATTGSSEAPAEVSVKTEVNPVDTKVLTEGQQVGPATASVQVLNASQLLSIPVNAVVASAGRTIGEALPVTSTGNF